ncbi:D-alanyl-D-alanine carboxypeptidase family protein [Anaerococcus degeneri]|uniref:Serine hydrolase n=1 Tax=Anaerococcus degeneri TaxID=361500 RepID=A0ABS7YWN4_9FIRM|nr:serine hydrolase [Anaerococcus degeneri]MBP2015254.1 D-alanyl-D-alanine carboxypeptidase (penicillin-binding protein 5/6) [Anaerococcus degeneri]MCA2096150.1 serine hydrolase [Anaerococcus degeneri]
MKKIRNLFIIALVLIIGVILTSRVKKKAEDEKFISKAVYLYNLTDDKEVLSKNENERLPMASLTKIMTVRVALKHITDLAETAPVDTDAYHRAVDMNASMAGFRGGEATSYRDLLYATMLRSAGEAADSLAINISGSMDNFVAMMNQEAEDLGLKNTSYANADGMDDPKNYQSAKDCAMLIKDSLEDGNFRAIFTKRDFVTRPTIDHPDGVYLESTVLSHLKKYNQNGFEIIGGKSGTTDKAGLCWATLAEKNGKEYILVVMGVPYDDIDNLNDGQIEETLRIYESIGD